MCHAIWNAGEEQRRSGRDIESLLFAATYSPTRFFCFPSFVTRETSELEKEPESFNTDFQRVVVRTPQVGCSRSPLILILIFCTNIPSQNRKKQLWGVVDTPRDNATGSVGRLETVSVSPFSFATVRLPCSLPSFSSQRMP